MTQQYKRMQRTNWATMSMADTVAADGKVREMVTIDRRTFTTCAPLPRVVIVALLLITSACGSTVGPRDESHDPQQPFVMPPLVDASGHPLPDLQQGRDWR